MKSKIVTIVVSAFLVRFILLVINTYWFHLPQGGADAVRFDRVAYQMSISSYGYSAIEIISDGTRMHVWLGSILYSIFGQVPFLWGLIMVILGTATVRNIHRGVFLITDNNKLANRSGWIAAFFPNLAVLSALVLREAPVHFFLSIAALFLIKYFKYKSTRHLFLFSVFGFTASLFHTGLFALFFGFVFFQILLSRKSNFFTKLIVSSLCIVGLYFVNQTGIGLNKFGGSFEAGLVSIQEGTGELLEHAGSNYPDWLHLKGNIYDLLLLPIRLVAFFFAPLIPFMVRTGSHLIGIIDVLFYMFILVTMYKRRKFLWRSDINKAVISMALAVSLVFALGVSNFGTNIRHRAKVLPLLLMVPLVFKSDIKQKYRYSYTHPPEPKST